MKWRKLIIATHRDVGYFFAGLTVIYAISGIAVNHIEDWNPNYVIRTESVTLGELPTGGNDVIAAAVLQRMQITETPESVVRMGPDQLKIFLAGRTLTVSLSSGDVVDEHARRRFAFFEVNYLHLNHGKGFWTWFADLYAAGLIVLACTGIFIITGRKGLGGRGRWLL
ncbi:MAG: hypothetical protein PVG53_09455, partial [Holophagae bacterium]